MTVTVTVARAGPGGPGPGLDPLAGLAGPGPGLPVDAGLNSKSLVTGMVHIYTFSTRRRSDLESRVESEPESPGSRSESDLGTEPEAGSHRAMTVTGTVTGAARRCAGGGAGPQGPARGDRDSVVTAARCGCRSRRR
jgi:hypothetical protein